MYSMSSPSLRGDAADSHASVLTGCSTYLDSITVTNNSRQESVERQPFSVTFCHAHVHCLCSCLAILKVCILLRHITYVYWITVDSVCHTSRWDKGYETCQLDKLSHTCLTKPCKVFEYFFEGERKGRGRDNIVKLDVIAEGKMNAVAFWFDLHLDEEESLCSGKHSPLHHSEVDEAIWLQHVQTNVTCAFCMYEARQVHAWRLSGSVLVTA